MLWAAKAGNQHRLASTDFRINNLRQKSVGFYHKLSCKVGGTEKQSSHSLNIQCGLQALYTTLVKSGGSLSWGVSLSRTVSPFTTLSSSTAAVGTTYSTRSCSLHARWGRLRAANAVSNGKQHVNMCQHVWWAMMTTSCGTETRTIVALLKAIVRQGEVDERPYYRLNRSISHRRSSNSHDW